MIPENRTLHARRRCAFCDIVTDELRCPRDGNATLLRATTPADPDSLGRGDVIAARYRIEHVLGRGGYGVVFAGRDERDDRVCAIKVLNGREESEVRLKRFFQEARVTAAIGHENVVDVYDFGQDDAGVVFIVMERLDGISLEERIGQAVLSEVEAAFVAVGILDGLAAAHEHGIIHRDLKPANVILHTTKDGLLPKIVDFGIAKLRDTDLTGRSQMPCTPAFASPEQARGQELDKRSDLYSMGVTLFRMVTADVPFAGANAVETLFMQVNKPPPNLSSHPSASVSENFAAIVRTALAKAPADRYADAAAMRRALEPCLSSARSEELEEVERTFVRTDFPRASSTVTVPLQPTPSVPAPVTPIEPPARRGTWLLVVLAVLGACAIGYGLLEGTSPSPAPIVDVPPTPKAVGVEVEPRVRVVPATPSVDPATPPPPPPPSIKQRPRRRRRTPATPPPPPPTKSVLDVEI